MQDSGSLTDCFQVSLYGTKVGFASSLPEALSAIRAKVLLPDWLVAPLEGQNETLFSIEPCGPVGFRAYRNGAPLFADRCLDRVAASLASQAHHWLATHGNQIFLHAGAVAYRGRVILLPGRSFCGKSTLTLALVERGAEYFSDEYAIVNSDTGLVEPFARPCRLRDRASIDLTKASSPVSKPLGWIFSLEHRPERGWRVAAMTAGEMVLKMFENAVAAQRFGSQCLEVLAASTRSVRGWTGTRGEADEAADWILRLLEASSNSP